MNEDVLTFFIEQVVRQYQDLRSDIRDLREMQAEDLKEFKQETNERFEKIERELFELHQFKWQILGASAIVVMLAEVGKLVFDYLIYK